MIKSIKILCIILFVCTTMQALEIRQPMDHEIEEIAKLYHRVWHNTFDMLSPEYLVQHRTQENCLAQWQEYYNTSKNSFILIALDDKRIVGVLVGKLLEHNQAEYADYDSEIDKLYVDLTYKSCGIGYKLLQAGFDQLRALGCKKTIIHSLATNDNANTFYEKRGGILINYDGDMNSYGFDLNRALR